MEATLTLTRGDIGFSAAHFSVHGGRSERLHGHNYRVGLSFSGAVGEEGTVVDFAELKAALRAACAELDERMLVPSSSPALRVVETADQVEVEEGSRRFVFPRGDVVLLPVANTTCECLAAHLLSALAPRLRGRQGRVCVRVEETPGQGATVSEDLPPTR
ncbi:MAG: 6-pyruvoyl trahydropterin synthase family protein [Candidatus Dormibacteria bacterium]